MTSLLLEDRLPYGALPLYDVDPGTDLVVWAERFGLQATTSGGRVMVKLHSEVPEDVVIHHVGGVLVNHGAYRSFSDLQDGLMDSVLTLESMDLDARMVVTNYETRSLLIKKAPWINGSMDVVTSDLLPDMAFAICPSPEYMGVVPWKGYSAGFFCRLPFILGGIGEDMEKSRIAYQRIADVMEVMSL